MRAEFYTIGKATAHGIGKQTKTKDEALAWLAARGAEGQAMYAGSYWVIVAPAPLVCELHREFFGRLSLQSWR